MTRRDDNLRRLQAETFDVLVIGGGINGAVSAAALSAKGAKVALIDGRDFAGFSSSQSSNLAWGGIKYMETYEFGLVRDLCLSRNELMDYYPSTVREIRFFTTLQKGFRHNRWTLLAGTWLYWLLGNGRTKTPRLLSNRKIKASEAVVNISNAKGGFEYSDAWLVDNDARFVFQFIRKAMQKGCAAVNYVEAISAVRTTDGLWEIQVQDTVTGQFHTLKAESIVNAAGAFADTVNGMLGIKTRHRHVFSKGIHLIVDQFTQNMRVLTFFADDGRLFFAIPMGDKTCIGTTDTLVDDPVVTVTPQDRSFILDNINARLALKAPLTETDIIGERCGVRPLAVRSDFTGTQDSFALSRRHVIDVDPKTHVVSIFGGKLTDCINTGEEVCSHLSSLGTSLPAPAARWFGEPPAKKRAAFVKQANSVLGPGHISHAQRLWRYYDIHAHQILTLIEQNPALARLINEKPKVTQAEYVYACKEELVVRDEDFLRRRSTLMLTQGTNKVHQT